MLWKECYKMGNEVIDRQHQMLFEGIDGVMGYILDDGQWDKHYEECAIGIQQLRPMALEHFKDEEEYMRSIKYGGIDNHIQLHREFVSTIRDFEYTFTMGSDKQETVKNFMGFMLMWLMNHVAGEDQKFLKKTPDVFEEPQDEKTWAKSLITGVSITLMKIFNVDGKELKGRPLEPDERVADLFVKTDICGDFNGSIQFGFTNEIVKEAINNVLVTKLNPHDSIVTSALAGIAHIITALAVQFLDKNGYVCVAGRPEFVDTKYFMDSDKKLRMLIESPMGNVTVVTDILA